MTPLRRLAGVALAGVAALPVLAASCGDVEDQATPHAAAPDAGPARRTRSRASSAASSSPSVPRSTLLSEGELGGFVPDESLVARAAALGDPATRDEAMAALFDLPDEERIALLRTALRLRDPVAARTAAASLEWRQLDAWETARFVALRTDAALDPSFTWPDGTAVTLDDVWEAFGSADVAALLDRLAAWPDGAPPPDPESLDAVDACVGLDALDSIARVLARPDAPGRDLAMEMLARLAARTDRRREDVAAALLGVPAAAARARFPDDRDLALAAAWSGVARDHASRGRIKLWRMRWLDELGPTAEEVEAERRRLERAEVLPSLERLVLESLQTRPEELKRRLLGGRIADPEGPPDTRGEPEGVEAWEEAEFALRALDQALATEVPWRPDIAEVFLGFAARAVHERSLTAEHLLRIAAVVPGCRTRHLAESALARLPDDRWPFLPYDVASADVDPSLPILETCAPSAFRDRLRRWSASSDPATRESAMHALVALRDVASAPAIVRWCEELRADNHADVPWTALGDIPHPAVREFLVRHVRWAEEEDRGFPPSVRHAVEAVARADGVGPELGWTENLPRASMKEVAAPVLEGRAVDAVFVALEAADPPSVEGLADVRDPRTIPALRRLRERREFGLWPQVTAELALAGDDEARAEVLDAIRQGRPGWLSAMSVRQRSLGDPVAAIPVWLDALERTAGAEDSALRWFKETFGMPEFDAEGIDATPAARVRAFLDRHGNRFVESRLAGHWVPAPR